MLDHRIHKYFGWIWDQWFNIESRKQS